jgi:hypothetical protein
MAASTETSATLIACRKILQPDKEKSIQLLSLTEAGITIRPILNIEY